MERRVAVFGIGNVLIGDDAVGPTVIRYLDAHFTFSEEIELEDLGTPSLDLAARMAGHRAVIFVDAVSAKVAPGTILRYTREQIVKNPPSIRMSPHDPSLKETVLLVGLLQDGPDLIELVGVVPESLDQFGLSATVREAVPPAAAAILESLKALGVDAVARPEVEVVPGFWEAA
jgi:hydrogenase maturation protease